MSARSDLPLLRIHVVLGGSSDHVRSTPALLETILVSAGCSLADLYASVRGCVSWIKAKPQPSVVLVRGLTGLVLPDHAGISVVAAGLADGTTLLVARSPPSSS